MDYSCGEYWGAMLNASLCKLLILRTVCEQPMHGYAIIWRLAAMTRQLCVPTQATVYPVLREFERCGCLRSRSEMVHGRERRVYTATAKGRAGLAAGMHVWRRALARLNVVVRESGLRRKPVTRQEAKRSRQK